jgi:hypothetical protein
LVDDLQRPSLLQQLHQLRIRLHQLKILLHVLSHLRRLKLFPGSLQQNQSLMLSNVLLHSLRTLLLLILLNLLSSCSLQLRQSKGFVKKALVNNLLALRPLQNDHLSVLLLPCCPLSSCFLSSLFTERLSTCRLLTDLLFAGCHLVSR